MMVSPAYRRAGWPLCAALAIALGGCAAAGEIQRPRPTHQAEFHVPPESVPQLGLCRIWYTELPAQWQPPAMSCARAHGLAQKHGGRVVKAISRKSFEDGRTMSIDFGPSNFGGVAPEQLPPPGYCRSWLDRVFPDLQPPVMTCARAEDLLRQRSGRLLYMPGPEAK